MPSGSLQDARQRHLHIRLALHRGIQMHGGEGIADGRLEQRRLRSEEAVERALGHGRAARHIIHAGGRVSIADENDGGSFADGLPPLILKLSKFGLNSNIAVSADTYVTILKVAADKWMIQVA